MNDDDDDDVSPFYMYQLNEHILSRLMNYFQVLRFYFISNQGCDLFFFFNFRYLF